MLHRQQSRTYVQSENLHLKIVEYVGKYVSHGMLRMVFNSPLRIFKLQGPDLDQDCWYTVNGQMLLFVQVL